MRSEENPEESGVFVGPDGVKRRTLLAGAAWTIPVIAVVTASPAMAASNDLTLAFDKSSYSGEGCGTITGAYVTASQGGAPAANQSVTVSLADGYTFDGGTTSHAGTTDSNGRVDLPAIHVPANGGDSTATATSGAARANAALSGSAAPSSLYGYTWNTGATTQISHSEKAIRVVERPGSNAFFSLDSDGSIRGSNGDAVIAGADTGDGLVGMWNSANGIVVTYKKNGVLNDYTWNTGATQQIPNSTNAIRVITAPVSSAFISLDSDGTIRNHNGQALVTGVDTGAGLVSLASNGDGGYRVAYKKNGSLYLYDIAKSTTLQIPNSSSAVRVISEPDSGAFIFLNSDGTIRNSAGDLVASGADTSDGLVSMLTDGDNHLHVIYKANGMLQELDYSAGSTRVIPNSANAIRVFSTPAYGSFVSLDSDGTIRGGDGGAAITEADTDAGLVGMRTNDGQTVVNYKKKASC